MSVPICIQWRWISDLTSVLWWLERKTELKNWWRRVRCSKCLLSVIYSKVTRLQLAKKQTMPAHHQFPPAHNTGTVEWKSCGKGCQCSLNTAGYWPVTIPRCLWGAANTCVCHLNTPAHHGNGMLQCWILGLPFIDETEKGFDARKKM